MNPKDNFYGHSYNDYCELDEEKEIYEQTKYYLDKKMEAELKAKRDAATQRVQHATTVYADLCDAAGISDLGSTVSADGTSLVIPVESIELLVARLASLQSNVLAEGVL